MRFLCSVGATGPVALSLSPLSRRPQNAVDDFDLVFRFTDLEH